MFKRAIIAVIGALVTGQVGAQTANVSLYGVADVNFEYARARGGTAADLSVTKVTSNSSNFGIRGTEDLGSGLAAIFQLENSVSWDGNNGTIAGRDTFVGLRSVGWGTLQMGNNSAEYRRLGGTDLAPGATGDTFYGNIVGNINGTPTGLESRDGSSVLWISPTWSGLSIKALVGADEARAAATTTTPFVNNWAYSLGADYTNGPLFIGYAFERHRDPRITFFGVGTNGDNSSLTGNRFVATYDFPNGLHLGFIYDRQRAEGITTVGSPRLDVTRTGWGPQVGYTVGSNRFGFEYTQAQKLTGSVCGTLGRNCDATGANAWSLAWYYNASRRTILKVFYSAVKNDANGTYDYFVNPVGVSAGANLQGIGAGIRHSF